MVKGLVAVVVALSAVALAGASFHTPDSTAPVLMFNNGAAIHFADHALEDSHFHILSAGDRSRRGAHIVQFHHALNPELIDRVTNLLGCPIGEHYGHFVFSVYTDKDSLASVRELPEVKWVGDFRPELKLSRELAQEKKRSEESGFTFFRVPSPEETMHTLRVEHAADPGEDFHAKMRTWSTPMSELEEVAAVLAQDFTEEEVTALSSQWMAELGISMFEFDHSPRKVAFMIPQGSAVVVADFLALQPEVKLVERVEPLVLDNTSAAGYVQSGSASTTTQWSAGLDGASSSQQYIAVADTGVDTKHCAFNGNTGAASSAFVTSASSTATASNPTFRYRNQQFSGVSSYYNADGTDTDGHGTHVAASAVGDTDFTQKGVAFDAYLSVYDMMGTSGSLVSPSDLANFYSDFRTTTSVQNNLFIQTNSWSSSCSSCPCSSYGYTSNAQETDLFLWDNQNFLVLFAAGNSGSSGSCTSSIASPSTAKNIITVGSSSGVSSLSSFSSIGPTEDGRTKPEIIAPGSSIVSAATGSGNTDNICTTATKSGTSMATPITAGAVAIIRQYYVESNYNSAAITPNADLMKATLFAGAEPFDSSNTGLSNSYGYGYVRLDNILYLSSSNNGFVMQTSAGSVTTTTNQVNSYCFSVTSTSSPFVVAMSYTDYPGTVGTTSSALVNDINLLVSAPDGRNYRGNEVTASYDAYNPNERVYITTPTTGVHCIWVYGRSINAAGNQGSTAQTFAYAARYGAGTAQASTVSDFITVTGTIMSGGAGSGAPQLSQDTLKSDGATIILTLPSGTTWAASGTTFNGQRQNILDGFTQYDSSKTTGWSGVSGNFDVSNVVRTSDTVVTITLSASAFSSYSIDSSNDYVKISIPASATSSGSAIPGHPNIEICYQSDCANPTSSPASTLAVGLLAVVFTALAVMLL